MVPTIYTSGKMASTSTLLHSSSFTPLSLVHPEAYKSLIQSQSLLPVATIVFYLTYRTWVLTDTFRKHGIARQRAVTAMPDRRTPAPLTHRLLQLLRMRIPAWRRVILLQTLAWQTEGSSVSHQQRPRDINSTLTATRHHQSTSDFR